MSHSLRNLLSQHTTQDTGQATEPITIYKRFASRISHKAGYSPESIRLDSIIQQDPAVKRYLKYLGDIRDNNGTVSKESLYMLNGALRAFLTYTDIPITDHAINDLVLFKRANPNDNRIEEAITDYASESNSSRKKAVFILGLFNRGNFTRLNCRVNYHPTPPEENCTHGIFRSILARLTQEQREMIQWGLYVPQRATATYRIPLRDIDLSRSDYAIAWISAHSQEYANKTKTPHPCFIPIDFARRVITAAQAAKRKCPFPNHQSEWKKITAFAKQEYNVRLVSNYTRKYFEDAADDTDLPASLAALIMGDKTMMAKAGHLATIYNLKIRPAFLEKQISAFQESGIAKKLNILDPEQAPETEIDRLRAENEELRRKLTQK